MNLLRPKPLPLLVAAALFQTPLAALAERVCELGDARQRSAISELCPMKGGLARIQIAGQWGFVDSSGKLAIAPQFDAVNDFAEGLAAAQFDDKWGFIDRQGQWVVKPTLEELDSLSNGLARAQLNGTDGYIDARGTWVIPPQYYVAGSFSPSVAVVEQPDHTYLLIDRTGRVVKRFAPEVRLNNALSRTGLFAATFTVPAMLAHVDGRRLPFPADATEYTDGVFIASRKLQRGDEEVDAVGLMDTAGKWIVPAQFASVETFHDKLAVAAPLPDQTARTRYGLIDKTGSFVVKPVYLRLIRHDHGYEGTRADGKDTLDVLDARGKLLSAADCTEVNTIATAGTLTALSGCAKTWLVHREHGLVKRLDGEWQADMRANHLLLTRKGEVGDEDEISDFGIYDSQGKQIAGRIPGHPFFGQPLREVSLVPNHGMAASPDQRLPLAIFGNYRSEIVGFLGLDGQLVTRPDWVYDSAVAYYGGILGQDAEGPLVMKSAKGFGAVDVQGNWLVPPTYDELGQFRHGLAFARTSDGARVIVDAAGKAYPLPANIYRLTRTGPLQLTGETEEGEVTFDLKTGTSTAVPADKDGDSLLTGETVEGLTPTKKGEKWGLVNASKAWVLAPSLANEPKPLMHKERLIGWLVDSAANDAWIHVGRIGLLDAQGRELIKPRFTELKVDEASGQLVGQEDGYLHSVLGTDGKTVLAPVDGSYTGLGDGWFKVEMNELHGLVDERGEWVVKPGRVDHQLDSQYAPNARPYTIVGEGAQRQLIDFSGRVSTRSAPLELKVDEPSQWWWSEKASDDEQVVFYSFNFKERVRLHGRTDESGFSEGVIAFQSSDPRHGGKAALMDDHGKLLGVYPYDHIGAMKGGMAMVDQAIAPKAAGKKQAAAEPVKRYGFLNRAGKLAVPLAFEGAADFSEQRATVIIPSGLAMIDDSGKLLLQGAWLCGRTPVLMDGQKKVVWPEEARAVTSCKR
ncbi:MAG: WG repeat-containing protein [Gammaproteobacteria bacterium]